MKSKRHVARCLPAPRAWRDERSFDRASVPRIADVASTAVSSEMIVPMPSVKAKPLTPAVASVNSTNATPMVTTFASMIVLSALP